LLLLLPVAALPKEGGEKSIKTNLSLALSLALSLSQSLLLFFFVFFTLSSESCPSLHPHPTPFLPQPASCSFTPKKVKQKNSLWLSQSLFFFWGVYCAFL
jgi:hypothetical protein